MKLYILNRTVTNNWSCSEEKEISKFDPVNIWEAFRKTDMFKAIPKSETFAEETLKVSVSENKNGENSEEIIFHITKAHGINVFDITWSEKLEKMLYESYQWKKL